jgi:hypothetical protein
MGKYVYVYYAGEGTDAGDEAAWGKWFGMLGEKIIDAGNPFGSDGKAVHSGGVMPVSEKPVTGYSIINAANMGEATELAKGCPLVASKAGAVCVYEALPM